MRRGIKSGVIYPRRVSGMPPVPLRVSSEASGVTRQGSWLFQVHVEDGR